MKKVYEKICGRIEEIILLLVIILNVLDFFQLLGPGMDYSKKIISWGALGYLLYSASLSKIFFGVKNKNLDLMLVLSYFMLIFNKITGYAFAAVVEINESVSSVSEISVFDLPVVYLITFLADNAMLLEKIAFFIGGIGLLILAVYSVYRIKPKAPSLMHVIHEDRKLKSRFSYFIRFISVYLVFVAFFVVVFNLMMEWLAIAVDAPLLMVAVFFYILFWIKHYKSFHAESMIFKLGGVGESFYEKFIELFHTKRGIFLGVSGMLVLHLLTDLGTFIVPYTIFQHDALYFAQDPLYFETGHEVVFSLEEIFTGERESLFFSDVLHQQDLNGVFVMSFIYLFNIIGIMFLFLSPAFVWYAIFSRHKGHVSRLFEVFYYMALVCFIMIPLFKIGRMESAGLIGVDVMTQSISSQQLILPIAAVLMLSVFVGVLVLILSMNHFIRKEVVYIGIISSLVFFALYVYYFFIDSAADYIEMIKLLGVVEWFFSLHLLLFFVITVFFYVGGLLLFLYEIVRYYRLAENE